MTRCTHCQELMERTVKPEHIEDLGGVVVKVLRAVVERSCPSCGSKMTAIPDMHGLIRVAAIARALHPLQMCGREVKYIRRALDMTQVEFAEAMDLSPEYISRWENNHVGVGTTAEKLLRHNVCALLQKEGACEYDPKIIAKMHLQKRGDDSQLPPFEFVRVKAARLEDDNDAGSWNEVA